MATGTIEVRQAGTFGQSSAASVVKTTARHELEVTTTGTAAYVQDSAGNDIVLSEGEIVVVSGFDAAVLVRFTGVVAAANGSRVPSGNARPFQCDVDGQKISMMNA